MLQSDLIGMGLYLYLGFILAIALPVLLYKAFFPMPFEVTRKMYHLVINPGN